MQADIVRGVTALFPRGPRPRHALLSGASWESTATPTNPSALPLAPPVGDPTALCPRAEPSALCSPQIAMDIKSAKRELKKARTVLQMDELKCRKRVLRRLGFATPSDVIEMKGRVACEVSR